MATPIRNHGSSSSNKSNASTSTSGRNNNATSPASKKDVEAGKVASGNGRDDSPNPNPNPNTRPASHQRPATAASPTEPDYPSSPVQPVVASAAPGVLINFHNDPNAQTAVRHLEGVMAAELKSTKTISERNWLVKMLVRIGKYLEAQYQGFNSSDFYHAVDLSQEEINSVQRVDQEIAA